MTWMVITDTVEYHYLARNALADIPFDRNEKRKGVSWIDSLNMILKHSGLHLNEEEKSHQAMKKNEHYKMIGYILHLKIIISNY
ncbi:hypothetical protein [Halobacillus hunanensis]|uniref:hypothetical protein n=1 Tax=Halobacillus hunanensis TaxID=578214 RepID=UPI0009A8DF59|nr:hypothetical protein [Halobacillus hunanensis]